MSHSPIRMMCGCQKSWTDSSHCCGSGKTEVGVDAPLLVHSDLSVVTETLSTLGPVSQTRSERSRDVPEDPLGRLLVQNFVTGCTAVANRALLGCALPFPTIVMHDWWLALCAAALGEILVRAAIDGSLPAARRKYGWLSKLGSGVLRGGAAPDVLVEELHRPVDRSSWRKPASWPGARNSGAWLHRQQSTLDALQDLSTPFSEGSGALHRLRVVRRHGITPRSLLFLPLVFYIRVMLWSPREEPVEDAATSTPLPRPQGRLRVDSARTTTDPTAGAAQ